MTSPGPDDTTRRLSTAAASTGAARPQLAFALANSDLNDSEIQMVGGFARALQLATTANLAHDSGARTDFTADEQNHIQGVGGQVAQAEPADSRSWLTKAVDGFGTAISNTGSWLFDNPITHGLGVGLDQFANLIHMPFRLLSDQADLGNNDEIDREMQADGYDPNSTTSYLAFLWNQGENTYHDLSDVRDTYGDDLVDQVIQYQRDPEQWSEDLNKLPTAEQQKLIDLTNSPDWVKAADLIDRQHISPGRDFARIITVGNTDNAVFTGLSGALDAAYTWFADPTLILGKANRVIKTFDVLGRDIESAGMFGTAARKTAAAVPYLANKRAGLQGITDQAGIEALLRTVDGKAVTKVGKAWESYLGDAAKLRAAHARVAEAKTVDLRAVAQAERAGILRAMDRRYGPLMGMVDEINGTRVISEIERAPREVGDALPAAMFRQGADRGAVSDHLLGEIRAGRPVYYRPEGDADVYETVHDEVDLRRILAEDTFALHDPAAFRLSKPGRVGGVSTGADAQHVVFPTNTQPIEDMHDLAKYLVSTNGMLRMGGGEPARRAVVMPGRLSFVAERRAIEDTRAFRKTKKSALIFDYTNPSMLPHESEAQLLLDGAALRGDAQFDTIRRSWLTGARASRARWDRVNRRLTTIIPAVKYIDLTDGSSTKLVEQIARVYLNKGDSARLASAYALGNVAERRQVVKGVLQQLFHASGLSRSEDGTEYMQQFLGDFQQFERQRYGLGDTDVIIDPITKTERRTALLQSQLATSVHIPSMREMNYLATKMAASGFTRRTGVASLHKFGQSPTADYLLGAIKLGWITTIAGGLRNALDEVANFAAYGMGREVLSARAAYTKGTATVRAERRAASLQYLRDAKSSGHMITEQRRREKIGEAYSGHEEAQRALDAAHRGALDLENAPKAWGSKLDSLDERLAQAKDEARTAKLKVDALTGSDDAATRGALAEEYRTALEREKAAEKAYLAHRATPAPRPEDAIAKVQERLDGEGVLSVPDAESNLTRAKEDLRQARILEGVIRHTIPLAFRFAADGINDLMVGRVLGKAMRVFGKKFAVTDEMVGYAAELTDRELTDVMRDGVFQSHYWDSGVDDPYAMSLHRAGLKARKYAFERKYEGYGEIEPDGGAGADAWAKMLQLAFEDGTSPAHAWLDVVRSMRRTPGSGPVFREIPHDVWERAAAGNLPGVSDDAARALDDAMGRVPNTEHETTALANGPGMDNEELRDLAAAQREVLYQHLKHELDSGREIRILSAEDQHSWVPVRTVDELHVQLARSPEELDHPELVTVGNADLNQPDVFQVKVAEASPGGLDMAALDAGKAAIVAHMNTPEMDHFRRYAEVFQQTKDGTRATTDELRQQAIEEYADRLSAHLLHATASRDGQIPDELVDALTEAKTTGQVPDSSWLMQQIPREQRPEKVLAQLWGPYNPVAELGQMPRGYTQMMATAYDKIVSDQIAAISRNPLTTALYINARRNTEPYIKQLEAAGWDRASATEVAKRMSLRHAETEALKHIDNPYVQSQASLVVRNYATFIRAQEDWLRRWGRTLKDNPQIIRQAQLLIHGAESAGHVEVNENGDLTFTYPGGALMSGVIDKVLGANGVTPGVTVPIASELSSKLMYMNPSLDNPVGLTATPLLSIPFDLIADWTMGPDQALLRASLDKAVNGQLGAGRTWYEKIIPSWAARIWQAFAPADDPGSPYAQAWAEAMAQIEASGKLKDPYYQSSTGQADLQHQVTVATRNNLVWKALFGIFAPAAPQLTIGAEGTLPHDDGPYGSGVKADWIYHQQGLTNLRDEARMMMSKYGYEQARVLWTAQHPGELIYFDSARTEVNTPSASAPATIAAASYIEQNPELFAHYGGAGGVAAYLIPQGRFGTKNGEFSDVSYQAELESGIRQYRSLNDYFTAVITSRGARNYYAAKDEFDRQHAAAIRAGNQSQAAEIDQQWAAVKATIMKNNPLLTKRFSDYAVDNAGKQLALEQIHELAGDPDPKIAKALGVNRAGLNALLDAYSAYQQGVAKLNGRRSRQATREKELLKTTYESQVRRLAGGPDPDTGVDTSLYPELADLARGVFRLPE